MGSEIDRDTVVKRSVELMRSGATLLAEVCPLCRSPLFRLRSGEIVCPIHGRVMVVKTEEEVAEAGVIGVLTELEKKISNLLINRVKNISEDEASYDDARDIVMWLEAIERIERIKQMLKQVPEQRKRKAEEKHEEQ
ncbi:MAG: Sjogren's syndrome/scleroderma autoantigen 1 family protein [Ignisphaera sp.]|uniref:Sjogrens syndrome scleroderma autoantigen 1 n=1 Tax=Ignisphaera aggregans TaxID=334771 RepID=A0A7C4D222_9CREN